MNAREERGRAIAAKCRITPKGNVYEVPSQTGNGSYLVNPAREYCSCPDHADSGVVCKHIFAVRFVLSRTDISEDGTLLTTTTLTVDATATTVSERTTYKQDWPNYNAAQVAEHHHFQAFLADLCSTLPAIVPHRGQKRILPADAAFSAIYKVYSTLSARRFMGNLDEAKDRGFLTCVPHFNSVLKFLEQTESTPILEEFVNRSAAPLAAVEWNYAVDSTGFAGARYVRWFDEKYGEPKSEIAWLKLHAMVGVKTNVVTSCIVTGKDGADSPQLPELVSTTAERFTVKCLGSA